MFGVAVAMSGYMRMRLAVWERMRLAVGGLLMIDPQVTTDGVGVALLLAVMAHRSWKARARGPSGGVPAAGADEPRREAPGAAGGRGGGRTG